MELVLIKFRYRYIDAEEHIGVAINMEAAYKHIDKLRNEHPQCYGSDDGSFHVEVFKVIEE